GVSRLVQSTPPSDSYVPALDQVSSFNAAERICKATYDGIRDGLAPGSGRSRITGDAGVRAGRASARNGGRARRLARHPPERRPLTSRAVGRRRPGRSRLRASKRTTRTGGGQTGEDVCGCAAVALDRIPSAALREAGRPPVRFAAEENASAA